MFLGWVVPERIRARLDEIRETIFAGRMDEWSLTDIDGSMGIRGPEDSFGVLVNGEPDRVVFDYHAPKPMHLSVHWHSYPEDLVVHRGEISIKVPGEGVTVLGEGDRMHIPAWKPHACTVYGSARFHVIFGEGSRVEAPE